MVNRSGDGTQIVLQDGSTDGAGNQYREQWLFKCRQLLINPTETIHYMEQNMVLELLIRYLLSEKNSK